MRVTDEFMQAVLEDREVVDAERSRYGSRADKYSARELLRRIAETAWHCGDPGMQYDTTINRWHTCKATDRI